MRERSLLWPLVVAAAVWVSSSTTVQAVDPAVIEAEKQRADVIDRISPAVVAIFGAGGNGGGSGVLISPEGYALTNYHVVSGAGTFMKCGLNDEVLYDAVIVGIDPTGDVAMVKLLGRDDFPVVELGDSDKVKAGDWAMAIGNPFLLAADFHPTVTFGLVSGVHRYQYPAGTFLEYTDCIQVDASINPGNSGGPLFNASGELIGINGRASFEKRGRVNSGAGYAISINQIKHFMDHLKSGRVVDHATLGATVRTEDDGTVVVDQILLQSEAFRRGLREGDELVSFGGRPIRSVNQFKNVLGIFPDGWKLPLVYRREGETNEIMVRLRPLHSESEMIPKQSGGPQRPGQPKPDAGPKVPAEFKKLHEKKTGFANFYFNKVNQDQLKQQLKRLGDFSSTSSLWELAGTTAAGESYSLTLAKAGVGLEVGNQVYSQSLADDADPIDEPPQSGGLLTAMHHLKKLLREGADSFTETVYIGSEILDGRGERVHVLQTSEGLVEARWYFSVSDETLVGFDVMLEPDVDECEVRFTEWAEADGLRMPKGFRVTSGGRELAVFQVDRMKLNAEAGAGD